MAVDYIGKREQKEEEEKEEEEEEEKEEEKEEKEEEEKEEEKEEDSIFLFTGLTDVAIPVAASEVVLDHMVLC